VVLLPGFGPVIQAPMFAIVEDFVLYLIK